MTNIDSFAGMSDEEFEASLESMEASISQEPLDAAPAASDVEVDADIPTDAKSPQDAAEEELDGIDQADSTDKEHDETAPSEGADSGAEEAVAADSIEKALYAPLKVNGHEVSITSVDEARQLMTMGIANAQFAKEHRKTIATLAEHKIDSSKLNLLIEAAQGNKEAIAQIIRDNKIDSFDLDLTEEAAPYTPQDKSVSDTRLALDAVIEAIQHTPTFAQTTDIVTKQWDEASRGKVMSNPQFLRELNEHVASGIYSKVMAEVTRVRLFGGLSGMSDIEAYGVVGKQLHDSGALKQEATPTLVVRKPKTPETNVDAARKVSPSRGSHTTRTNNSEPNYIGMSDSEFEKLLSRGR